MIAGSGIDDWAARAITTAIAEANLDSRVDLVTSNDLDKLGLRLEKAIVTSQKETLDKFWIVVALIVALSGGINAGVTYLVSNASKASSQSGR